LIDNRASVDACHHPQHRFGSEISEGTNLPTTGALLPDSGAGSWEALRQSQALLIWSMIAPAT